MAGITPKYGSTTLVEELGQRMQDPDFARDWVAATVVEKLQEELRGMMSAAGLTLADVAKELGFDTTVLRLECGVRVLTLCRVAAVCGGDVEIILRRRDPTGAITREVSVSSLSAEPPKT